MDSDKLLDVAKNISEVAPQAYDDTIHPSAKNVGKALGTVTDLLNTVLTPIEILNKTVELKKERFLKEYEENLTKIPPEKQCQPNFEIVLQIVDHLKFKITEDTLRQKYAKLLSEASNTDSCTKPLLSFDNVLNQISPYEIELLKQLFSNIPDQRHELASIKVTSQKGYHFPYKNIPNISFRGLSYEEISIMLSNFERLGIINIDYLQYIEPNEKYNYIYHSKLYLKLKEECDKQREATNLSYPKCLIEKYSYYLTEFGKSFVLTVII